jgi:hypothetical protein
MLPTLLPRYIAHPLSSHGPDFWGGIGGDLTYLTLLLGFMVAAVRGYFRHQCHVAGCWRPSWHPDPVHGHPVCRHHHPQAGRCVPDGHGGSKLLEDAPALPPT